MHGCRADGMPDLSYCWFFIWFLFDDSLEGYKLVYTVFHIGLIYESSLCANYFFIGLFLMGQNLIEGIAFYSLRHLFNYYLVPHSALWRLNSNQSWVLIDIIQYVVCIKGFRREILLDLPWAKHILAHSSQLLLILPQGIIQ